MSDRILLPEPRSWQSVTFTAAKGSKKVIYAALGADSLLVYESKPLAVLTGGVVYAVQTNRTPAQTRALNEFSGLCPVMQLTADQFDFTLGCVLTRTGLPLTRMETSSNG